MALRAEVDPALVHHHFDGKADLLAAAIGAPVRPDEALETFLAGPRDETGAEIIRFLAPSTHDERRQRTVAMLKAMGHCGTGWAVGAVVRLRELVRQLAGVAALPNPQLRATLTASQTVGLLMCRNVLGLRTLG